MALDASGEINDLYAVQTRPTTYVIARDGTIHARHFGIMTEPQLRELSASCFRNDDKAKRLAQGAWQVAECSGGNGVFWRGLVIWLWTGLPDGDAFEHLPPPADLESLPLETLGGRAI